jgi:succinoglycan biosynthesis transport protein ExoP
MMLNRLSPKSTLFASAPDEQSFDLWEIISFAWREWKFIAAVVGMTLLVGTIYVLHETPLYTASADLLLEPGRARAPNEVASTGNLDNALVESQMALIKSSAFLRRVVEREHLYSDPEFGSVPKQDVSFLAKTLSLIPFFGVPAETKSQPPETKNPVSSARIDQATNALKYAVSVYKGMTQLYVFSVSVTSVDPVRAARLANAVAAAYVVEKLDARLEAAKRSSAWFTDRLAELGTQLRKSEEAVAKYRAEHNLIGSLSQQQLSELNAKLVAARTDTAAKKVRLDLLKSIEAKGGNVQSLPELVGIGSSINSLSDKLATVKQKEADLTARYTRNYPLVVNLRAERREIERAIASEMKQVTTKIRNDYELAKAKEAAMEQSLQEATGQTGIDNKTAIKLRELERTAAANKTLYEDFLQKSKMVREQATYEARDARVINPAQPPGAPSSPKIFRSILVMLFLGSILGIGGAVAKERLNSGFVTPQQIEEVLELPLLASVNRMGTSATVINGKVIPIAVLPIGMPRSHFSEEVRMLRNRIRLTDVDNPPKIIQVTSTLPNEGKTTVALSLAASAAATNVRVLFIDADTRNPAASDFLGIRKERGLVDLLLDNASPQTTIKYNETAKYWVLGAGRDTQNPTDLLSSERMKSLLEICRRSFDYVIIDTPPVAPFADPLLVSRLVDKTVYVVRWKKTPREMVTYSLQKFPDHEHIAGIVFNFVNEAEARKHGKHAYSHYDSAYRDYYDKPPLTKDNWPDNYKADRRT